MGSTGGLHVPEIWQPRHQVAWPIEVNEDHPIAAGCRAAFPFLPPGTDLLHEVSGRTDPATLTTMDPATDWVLDADANHGSGGWALDFDGSNDHCVGGRISSFSIVEFTFSAWIRYTSANNTQSRLFSYVRSATPSTGVTIKIPGSQATRKLQVLSNDEGTSRDFETSSADLSRNTWHHVLVVLNNGTWTFYIDGDSKTTSTTTGAPLVAANDTIYLGVGNTGTGTHFYGGQLSNIIVWLRALSVDEAQLLFHQPWIMYRPRIKKFFIVAAPAVAAQVKRRLLVGVGL